jgi:hypothetical protein
VYQGIFGRKKKLSQARIQVNLNEFKMQLNSVIFVQLVSAICAIEAVLRVELYQCEIHIDTIS